MLMSKKILVGILVVIVIVVGYWFLIQKQYKSNSTPTASPQPAAQSQNTVEANTITIANFAFNPGSLTIKVGTKVTWINQDSTAHRIKSNTFNSTDLNQGEKFEFTFNNPGSFDYICGIHPSMSGKIVVE